MTDTTESGAPDGDNPNEPLWRQIFQDGHPFLLKQHWLHKKLPSPPRCRLCYVPFSGLGGWYMRRKGRSPSDRNEHYCSACDGFLEANPGGAEVEMTLLFADIRQSSKLAADIGAAAFATEVNRFYQRIARALADSDGFVVELRGDCMAGAYPPGFSGQDHAAKAIRAAQKMVRDNIGGGDPGFGVGVHTGPVFIGTVGAATGRLNEISIFGEAVNLAANLGDLAGSGQALISVEAAEHAGMSGALPSPENVPPKVAEQTVTAHRLGS